MQRAEDLPVQDFSEEGAHQAAAASDAHTTGGHPADAPLPRRARPARSVEALTPALPAAGCDQLPACPPVLGGRTRRQVCSLRSSGLEPACACAESSTATPYGDLIGDLMDNDGPAPASNGGVPASLRLDTGTAGSRSEPASRLLHQSCPLHQAALPGFCTFEKRAQQ